jgi:hypothetical protein
LHILNAKLDYEVGVEAMAEYERDQLVFANPF